MKLDQVMSRLSRTEPTIALHEKYPLLSEYSVVWDKDKRKKIERLMKNMGSEEWAKSVAKIEGIRREDKSL